MLYLLSDFLQDGLGMKGHRFQTQISALLTLGPPLVALLVQFSWVCIGSEFSGVIVTFLFGILPVLAWQARYVTTFLPGGKVVLVLVGLVSRSNV